MVDEGKEVVGIIGGEGLIGRLFVNFFKKHGFEVIVSDLGTKLTNEELAQKADIVIVSVPIDTTCEVIKKIVHHVRPEALLMDVTSVKEAVVLEMLKGKSEVIGLHPMCGGGSPIEGQTMIICPVRSKKWLPRIKKLFKKGNIQLETMAPKKHDQVMAEAQVLIHFADIVFGHTLKNLKRPVKDLLQYASMASDIKVALAGRVLAQNANLYGNIQIGNPNSEKVIKEYIKASETLLKIVKKKNLKEFEKYFNEARKFLGDYADKSYNETEWVINELLKKRGRINASDKLPREGEIGVLGPKYTYSDLASCLYDKEAKKAYFTNIAEVFDAIEKGEVKKGIVPIENMLQGTIRETLDELFKRNLKITKEIKFPIHHCFIVTQGSKSKEIKEILSHPQAFKQCSRFIKNRYKKAKITSCESTAAALQTLIQERSKEIAVIGAKEAADAYGLQILKENIEDSHENKTTFIVVEKKASEIKEKEGVKTSIAFCFSKNKPGSLFAVFKDFAGAKVNLTKIESRPARKDLGEYIFFLDFEGNPNQAKVKKVIDKIKTKTTKLKILGTYLSA